jgi:hypothetical protein
VASYDNSVLKHGSKESWEELPKQQSLQTEKLSERDGFTPKMRMDNSEKDVLQDLVQFPENIFKRIMHQSYQTQHYTYSQPSK